MQQIIKRYFWIALLVAGLRSAWGFSLLGPLPPDPGGEPWQILAIGYAQPSISYFGSIPGGPNWLQDIGGPHNLGEEYRRNTPVLYYGYDASFQAPDYFGLEAVTNIDGAFAMMNSLTNVDLYSPGLSEFPLSSQEYNYTATSLYLTDMKSIMLHLLVEQLGLADPARYSWALHDRDTIPGLSCPIGEIYMVIQRNFDIVPSSQSTLQYSPYVNGALLSYYISEVCSGSSELADTVPYLTDPSGQQYGPVSANTFLGDFNGNEFSTSELLHLPTIYGLQIGGYYTGLTRDDVGGLRYLLTTNNINFEPIPATSVWFSVLTNFNTQALFPSTTATNISGINGGFYTFDGTYGYGDYGFLLATSVTNSPAVLQALYPGLVIASSSNYFGYVTNFTFTQYFTNAGYGSTYPPPLILVTVTNAVLALEQKYLTTFANVFTNNVRTNTTYQLQTTTVQPNVKAPFGSPPVTNTSVQTVTQNIPSGDFFVLPMFHTNVCPLDFLYTGLTNVLAVTNFLTGANTNIVTPTNSSSFSSIMIQVNYFTNYTWVTHPIACGEISNAPNYYQGIGRVSFQKVNWDSLLGLMNPPVTNYYTMVVYTNGQLVTQPFVRVITQPDILIGAGDLAGGGSGVAPFVATVVRDIRYNSSHIIPGLRGPGVIDTPTTIVFDKVGPTYFNGPFADGNSFLNPTEVNETTQMQGVQWASFDGSTNVPVVYPNGTSIQEYQNQMLVQLTSTPAGALVGTNNLPVSYQFNATGGGFVPSFTWAASGQPIGQGILYGLPPGLNMSSTGLLSGTPTASGTYDFTLTLTDSNGRSVNWGLSITIN